MKKYIYILGILFASQTANSQTRILPISEMSSSAQSLGLGDVKSGEIHSAYIYNNPIAIFLSENKIALDYSIAYINGDKSHNILNVLTSSYRHKAHAFFIGAKYLDMGKFGNIADNDMNYTYSNNRIYSYQVNAGYAYNINDRFAFSSTIGYVEERVATMVNGYYLDVAGGYNDSFDTEKAKSRYSINIAIDKVGRYNFNDNSGMLAPFARFGGSFITEICKVHKLGLYADFGWHLPTQRTELASVQNIGFNYTIFNRIGLSTGGILQNHNKFLTCGLNAKLYKDLELTVSGSFSNNSHSNNTYMLGLRFGL